MSHELCERLRRALNDPTLIHHRLQMRRAFSPALSYGRHFGPAGPQTKAAAVMILLEDGPNGWTIPLTVRPQTLPDHPGQISFPGGRLEENESEQQAAEREFVEELGAPFEGMHVGTLNPIYVFNSDYFVRPFLAIGHRASPYRPCPDEVDRIVHLPVETLLSQDAYETREYGRGQVNWRALAIRYQDDCIWGATAVLLGELAAVLTAVTDSLNDHMERQT